MPIVLSRRWSVRIRPIQTTWVSMICSLYHCLKVHLTSPCSLDAVCLESLDIIPIVFDLSVFIPVLRRELQKCVLSMEGYAFPLLATRLLMIPLWSHQAVFLKVFLFVRLFVWASAIIIDITARDFTYTLCSALFFFVTFAIFPRIQQPSNATLKDDSGLIC